MSTAGHARIGVVVGFAAVAVAAIVAVSCFLLLGAAAQPSHDGAGASQALLSESKSANTGVSSDKVASDKVVANKAASATVRDSNNMAYDNSDLAHAACSLAYTRSVTLEDGHPGAELYTKLWARLCELDSRIREINDAWAPEGRSCDAVAAVAIRWSGCDENFPIALFDQSDYLNTGLSNDAGSPMDNGGRWEYVGAYHTDDLSQLQPGDIVIDNGHIAIFVGPDIPKEVYRECVEGTDRDLGEPYDGAVWVNGGAGRHMPAVLTKTKDAHRGVALKNNKAMIYRCVNASKSGVYKDLAESV